MVIMNPRRSRRTRRAGGTRRRRRNGNRFIFKNPSLSGATSAVKRGFSPDSFKLVLPLAAGAVGNVYASEFAAAKLPDFPYKDKIMPFLTAGGMLAIAALFKQPALGFKLFTGGMTQAVIKTLLPYVVSITGDPGTAFNRPIIAAAPQKALPAPTQTIPAAPAMSEFTQMSEFIQM